MCKLLASQSSQNGRAAAAAGSILEIFPAAGNPYKIIVAKNIMAQFNFGDRIKSVAGTTIVLVKPGTRAGAFILSPHLPVNPAWNQRTELEINDESTKNIPRGEINLKKDIGNTTFATSSTTR